jgi:hypothetical protein
MGTLRAFSYDDPNYSMVRQVCTAVDDIAASTTQFGKFRSRVACVVNAAVIVAVSAASVAKVIYTILRNSSINTTVTIVSATSSGAYTLTALDMTLLSAGDLISVLSDSGGGEYQVLYEYQILPSESLYKRA